jgi:hypothetical protein
MLCRTSGRGMYTWAWLSLPHFISFHPGDHHLRQFEHHRTVAQPAAVKLAALPGHAPVQVHADSIVLAPSLTADAVDLEGSIKNDAADLGVVNHGLGKLTTTRRREPIVERRKARASPCSSRKTRRLWNSFARPEPEVKVLQVVQWCGDHDFTYYPIP